MIGSLLGVSLIAQELGANIIGQVLASIFCISIPMGILQSVTTQNDYVVSFWLVCLAYNALLISSGKITRRISLEFGSSLGLAILTKATAYVYAFPFCVVWIVSILRESMKAGETLKSSKSYCSKSKWLIRDSRTISRDFITDLIKSPVLKVLIVTFLPALLINISHYWRNLLLFGSPLGSSQEHTKNVLFTFPAILSNLIRGIAIHLATPIEGLNISLESLIVSFHTNFLKVDVSEPATTHIGTSFSLPDAQPIFLHEDISGNPFHLVLIIGLIIIYCFLPKLQSSRRTLFLTALSSAYLLFCILVAWQPWISRLHLPLFVLFSSFTGAILGDLLKNRILITYFLISAFFISSLPYVFFSAARPLFISQFFISRTGLSVLETSRIDQYFNNQYELREPYIKATNQILQSGCSKVGLYMGIDSWEYPFWTLLNKNSDQTSVEIRNIKVENISIEASDYDTNQFIPCAILTVNRQGLEDVFTIDDFRSNNDVRYQRVEQGAVNIYFRRAFLRRKESF
jgi:hypothetical protein